MGLPGITDQTVYRGLKDVLIRQPEITIVQYEHPASNDSGHEGIQFSKSVPTEILWSALEQLFETKIPELSDGT